MSPVATLETHQRFVYHLTFSPDSKLLAAGSDGGVGLWNVGRGWEQKHKLTEPAKETLLIQFASDAQRLAIASVSPFLFLYDTQSYELVAKLKGQTNHVAFSSDAKVFAAAQGNSINVINSGSGDLVHQLRGHRSRVEWLAFASTGRRLISSGARQLNLWDSKTAKQLRSFTTPSSIHCVRSSPSGTCFAVAGGKGLLQLYNHRTTNHVMDLEFHENDLWDIAFSPDGARLATAGDDAVVSVWDTAKRKQLATLEANEALGDLSLQFSPNGQLLAAVSEDHLEVWKTNSFEKTADINVSKAARHASPKRLAFSPNGRWLAVACDDGKTRIWSTSDLAKRG